MEYEVYLRQGNEDHGGSICRQIVTRPELNGEPGAGVNDEERGHLAVPNRKSQARSSSSLSFSLSHSPQEPMNAKRKAVLDRIDRLEAAIARAREYLGSGEHAQWSGFRPLFVRKFRYGKELPPHRDWVKNVFLPNAEKSLSRAEKTLERLDHPRALSH
jgi:hypothetical protein